MTRKSSRQTLPRLGPRDPRGGRPNSEIAARLGEHILDVALEHFVAHGAEGASMDTIATAANVSKRTLYSRFGSKMALLIAVVDRGVSRQVNPIKTSIPAGALEDRLKYVARRMLDISLRPEMVGLAGLVEWIGKQGKRSQEAQSFFGARGAIALFEDMLRESPGFSEMEPDHLSFLAALIFDASVTIPRQRILVRLDLENPPRTKAKFIDRTISVLFDGLRFPASPSDG